MTWEDIEKAERLRAYKRWEYLSGKETLRIGFFPSGNINEADTPDVMLYLDEVDRLEALGVKFVYDDTGNPCSAAEIRALSPKPKG